MTASDAAAIPAEMKAMRVPSPIAQAPGAKTRATLGGMALWKTIAPVMLPRARLSLPWRTQMTLLNFSGSSVAMGAITSARSVPSMPKVPATRSTAPTKNAAPTTMHASATSTWNTTTAMWGGQSGSRRAVGLRRRRRSGSGSSRSPSRSSPRWERT